MKQLPGAMLGIIVALVAWLATSSLGIGVIVGIAAGIGWDLWRKR